MKQEGFKYAVAIYLVKCGKALHNTIEDMIRRDGGVLHVDYSGE
jgi:hypothetical protein